MLMPRPHFAMPHSCAVELLLQALTRPEVTLARMAPPCLFGIRPTLAWLHIGSTATWDMMI
jgi:hypothetical protein